MALTDILDSITKEGQPVRPVEMGRIKIGGKESRERQSSGGSWRKPEMHDHFTITTMNKQPNGDFVVDTPLMNQLVGKYGDPDGKLRRIPIRVLSDDIEDFLQGAFVWYAGKPIFAVSDGKTVTWFRSPTPDGFARVNTPPKVEPWDRSMLEILSPKTKTPIFKLHVDFSCVIAAPEAKWGGVYKLRTTGVISTKQIFTSLCHIQALTGGILRGMPLMLVVRPMQVSPMVNGSEVQSTVQVMHVELVGPDLLQIQQDALKICEFRTHFFRQIQDQTHLYRRLLAGPGSEGPEEAQAITDEFAPENRAELEAIPENSSYPILDGPVTKSADTQQGAAPKAQETPAPAPQPGAASSPGEKRKRRTKAEMENDASIAREQANMVADKQRTDSAQTALEANNKPAKANNASPESNAGASDDAAQESPEPPNADRAAEAISEPLDWSTVIIGKSTAQDAPDEINEWLNRPWTECKDALYKAAKIGKPDLTRAVFEKFLHGAVVGIRMVRNEEKISMEARRAWYDRMAAGKFSFESAL
jgi:hypothetical protein